ncbi:MAG: hypothetical protein KC561_19960 [Myxococcales bacterium]|nr:hypothetical protein [Myxococcales bacterium]
MTEETSYRCWACGHEVDMSVKIARRDTCDSCVADLHCCKNCRFYDPGAHNECRESVSAWVRDKEASNFCQMFQFAATGPDMHDEVASAKSKLDALFSKLK